MARESEVLDEDSAWQALMAELGAVNGVEISVGIQSEDADQSDGPNLAFIAGVHEFGSSDGRIPQRSFLRSTFDEEQRKWGRMLREAITLALSQPGTGNARARLDQLATLMQSDVQEKIRSRIPPPLAQSTQERSERRAGENITPLIDEGTLINAILGKVTRR